MTIIRPKKTNKKAKLYITGLTAFTICAAISGVFLYNQNVNYKHEIADQKNEMREIESKNAEIKTKTFNLTSAQNMNDVATTKGLVLDNSPKFIKVPQLATR